MIRKSQAGDTIVEVLIAIVVIATVLAGAFLVSRSSLKHVREAEEHNQALNLVQGQVEQLRNAASKVKTVADLTSYGDFCMKGSAPVALSDAACAAGPDNLYKLSIKNTGSNTYQVTAKWDSINSGTSQVQLVYRVAFSQ